MIKFKLGVIVFVMLFAQSVFSQTNSVSGVVTDDTGALLPGVTIIVKDTNNGTTTDFDGKYVINNVRETDQLVFSSVGMTTRTIAVNGRTTIDVSLTTDVEALEEVTIIGYGSQSTRKVTGAVSSVNSEELTAVPVATADQALQGRAAGLTVVNSGSPGSTPVIRIRGLGTPNNNEPIYVIDGVITGGIGDLNPNDIESISVLKDASTTAIYGSQGANGVVIVTTKGGKPGKVQMSFNSYAGFQAVTQRYDVLSASEYLQYANDLGVTPAGPFANSGLNTDWQEEIFRTGLIQNYDFSVAGGGENHSFRVSSAYTEQEGVFVETGLERYNFRANGSFNIGKFKFGESLGITFNRQNPVRASGGRSVIEHAIKSAPYLPVFNPDNTGGFQGPSSSLDGQDAENPVRVQTLGEVINRSVAITGSMFGELELFDGLKYKSQVGLEYRTNENDSFVPSYNDGDGTHAQNFALIDKGRGSSQIVILTNSLNYKKTIADVHNLDVLAVAETYDGLFKGVSTQSRNEISDDINEVSNVFSALSSGTSELKRISYFGRLSYDYDNKYLFSATFRRDATSRFGANNRWGNFPSIALGWNIAQEAFMEDTAFSTLKLRGSWGIVGNDKISDYLYSASLDSNFNYVIDGQAVVGTTASSLPNPDLKWEETIMRNVGLDIGLFNEKITASIEYYKNESSDLLFSRPLFISSGLSNFTENIGSVESSGFEFALGYSDSKGDFSWSVDANFATATNEALELGVDAVFGGGFENESLTRIFPGETLFHFYGLETDGIYQNQAEVDAVFTGDPGQTTVQPGDVRFVDQLTVDTNGDGIPDAKDGLINADDRVITGQSFPDITYGLNLSANYKNWDMSLFINGVAGNDIYNTNRYDTEGMTRLFNSGTAVLDRWTPTNPSTTIPRALGAPQNVSASDRFLEDGSFTRLKNLTIGYTLNQGVFDKYFSKLRVYLTGTNLVTITDYSGLDPEVGSNNNTENGIDRGIYPQPKSVLMGIQVSF